ncbi:hypothetical protein D9756_006137 [Leucocoprinus leucothites]|uniref:F-box domain-containing protein n=1 Tax=Leucocoprinus leucothites TaxID=201217 RepID=A0A8H5FXA6_9AGAR|nr:hypothetical protein D9756_006137 [Leucoagaricus leucothites]
MSLATTLPLELIHHILEADYLSTDGEPDRRLLRACSLVCNAWSTPAQYLLFSNVVLRSESDFQSFRLALSRSSLANAVRSLRVVIDHNQPRGLRQHHLAAALASCPRLNSISLALFGDGGLNDSVEGHDNENSINDDLDNIIRTRFGTGAPVIPNVRRTGISLPLAEALTKSPITSFHLSNWSSNPLFLQNILKFLPSLKSLSIAGTPPSVHETTTSPVDPCSLSLNQLRINFQPSPSVDFLRWLLDNSKDTLTALDLERISDSDASIGLLDHFATTQGPTLRSLILPSCTNPTELKHFQRCNNLRAVAFRTPNVSSALFKYLLAAADPTPLEEMYLCMDKNTSLSPVIEFVRNKATLKSLVVCLWEPDVRKSLRLWGSLKMACAVSGVELKVVERLSEYKALIKSNFERV